MDAWWEEKCQNYLPQCKPDSCDYCIGSLHSRLHCLCEYLAIDERASTWLTEHESLSFPLVKYQNVLVDPLSVFSSNVSHLIGSRMMSLLMSSAAAHRKPSKPDTSIHRDFGFRPDVGDCLWRSERLVTVLCLFIPITKQRLVNCQIGRHNLFPGLSNLLVYSSKAGDPIGRLAVHFVVGAILIAVSSAVSTKGYLFYGLLSTYCEMFWGGSCQRVSARKRTVQLTSI